MLWVDSLVAKTHSKVSLVAIALSSIDFRVGHSRLTHSYLLSNDDVPLCETCGLLLTVKHILVTCTSW